MDKGTKNYRNMMKNMEKGMGEEKVPASMNMGMDSMQNVVGGMLRPGGMMGGTPDMLRKSVVREGELMELPDGNIVTREGERIFDDMGNIMAGRMDGMGAENIPASKDMGMDSMIDDAMSGMSMADREAIEALTTMGISLEDAIEAVMGNMRENMLEGAVGATMGGGALGALPNTRSVVREGEMGADRTENPMNTITSRNAPST